MRPIDVQAAMEAPASTDPAVGGKSVDPATTEHRRTNSDDSARLLLDFPEVFLRGNGGISSLPVVHGMADDRVRILVDGVELSTACPNHMNSPLSYVEPRSVGTVTVFAGPTPVSLGGDSIGGTIQVSPPPPRFATEQERYWVGGRLGSFYRSNGDAFGVNLAGSAASTWLYTTYSESRSQSDNYVAGGNFKPATPGREGGDILSGRVVGSSAYRGAVNRSLLLAVRRFGQDLSLELSRQTVDFEGFPNQRMDMTGNDNRLGALRYRGVFTWGDLLARASYQTTAHAMDMGPDRYRYGTGMPMRTRAKNRGVLLQGNFLLSESSILRLGGETQYYTLFDYWPPASSTGSMGPSAFWNIDYGRRRRVGGFLEWESAFSSAWATQVGLRHETVTQDAAAVQGYNRSFDSVWAEDAANFNEHSRRRVDRNWDATAMMRYHPVASLEFVLGIARKTHSPNLYQRYAWSANAMAALMNNLLGDGNGYVGNVKLKPEVAHTINLAAKWQDPRRSRWELHAASFLTFIDDYIDARRCPQPSCSGTRDEEAGFVLLQYTNQPARIHGLDLSARVVVAQAPSFGSLTAKGVASYAMGKNLSTGDGLYDIMPPNARLTLEHAFKRARIATEVFAVADRIRLSRVRNEVATQAYWLLNLRFAYALERTRFDFAVENLLDRLYSAPLGGAYVGQGPSMTTSGIPWGIAVPGRGRSFDLSFNYAFE